jgi:hypothetical protein
VHLLTALSVGLWVVDAYWYTALDTRVHSSHPHRHKSHRCRHQSAPSNVRFRSYSALIGPLLRS